MKFKCRMNDVASMRDFLNIITAVSRMCKMCVLRLTESALFFTVEDERSPMVWAELNQEHFFDRYTMSGVCQEQNEIYLEFDPTMFARSLSSLRTSATSVEIKLTNKQQPCLTLEIEMPTHVAQARQCVHDVPVRVVPRREWSTYKAPDIPEFDISMDMPQLKNVRNIVEHLKNMSPYLQIEASDSGNLAFKVETDWAVISTHFNNLTVWNNKENAVSVNIDVKRLLMFLAWDIVRPESVKCNILDKKLVNFYLTLDPFLTIQYIIPSIAS